MFEIIAGLGVLTALPLRLVIGAALVAHGYPKLNRKTMERMKGMGLPPAATAGAALTEFVGGIALIIGFLTPLASLLIALEMIPSDKNDAPGTVEQRRERAAGRVVQQEDVSVRRLQTP